MSLRRHRVLVACLSCALGAAAAGGQGQDARAGARSTTLVANPGPRGGEWKRAFNPFRDDTDTRWPATAGVYEPLLVYSRATRSYLPWLATGYQWGASNLTLKFAIRSGVLWSDGQPFSGKDVAFTFDLIRRTPAINATGLKLTSAEAKDDKTAVLTFPATSYTEEAAIVGNTPIIPA